jgi:hypothetical protein
VKRTCEIRDARDTPALRRSGVRCEVGMAVLLVTYEFDDAAAEARAIHDYLRQFEHCRQMEALWLVDTAASVGRVRDELRTRAGTDSRVFVARLIRDSPVSNERRDDWLNRPERSW